MFSKRILKKKVREFCGHCSLNGFYYFSHRHSWPVYFIWAIVIASSTGLCGYLGNMIWTKFAVDPTFTVVETTHYSTSNLGFPAVTVCDEEAVYGPATENITNILSSLGYTQYEIGNFYTSFRAYRDIDYKPPHYVNKMHAALNELSISGEILVKLLHKPCEVLLVLCQWRSKPHNCSQMFRDAFTYMGHCCTFDMNYFRSQTQNEEINFVPGTEVVDALSFVINAKDYLFNGTVNDGYASLFIHEETTQITLMDSYMTLSSSGIFDVDVDVSVITSSDDVKKLPLKSRRCLIDTDDLTTGPYYQKCMSRLIMSKVINKCRCIPFSGFEQLNENKYPVCSFDRFVCICQAMNKVRGDIRDIIKHNECFQKCDYIQYNTEIEYLQDIRRPIRHSSNTQRIENRDYSTVAIHFTSSTCIKYRREVLYTWDQMLANLGGVFGLCLGGSIISIIEVLWFIIDVLSTIVVSWYKRNKTSPKKWNKKRVFTISEKDFDVKRPPGKFNKNK